MQDPYEEAAHCGTNSSESKRHVCEVRMFPRPGVSVARASGCYPQGFKFESLSVIGHAVSVATPACGSYQASIGYFDRQSIACEPGGLHIHAFSGTHCSSLLFVIKIVHQLRTGIRSLSSNGDGAAGSGHHSTLLVRLVREFLREFAP